MSLIVEDGTGLSTAESYVSVVNFRAYRPRGALSIPAATTDEACESALIRGTAAVDGMNCDRWPGYRKSVDQALDWPRYDAIDTRGYEIASDSVPREVVVATCEAALIELSSAGALTKSQERGGMVAEDTVGPITTKYFQGAPAGTRYPVIDQALARIVRSGGLKVRRG